ncbi:MAG: hypothetical protein IT462_06990 [Planctomycetes bacterium]|nr:hypothetical protein [Planctomycetota bacterium]
MRTVLRCAAFGIAAAMVLSIVLAQAPDKIPEDDTFEAAKREFELKHYWDPLGSRNHVLDRVASTHELEALKLMRAQYFKPHTLHPVQEKYCNAACLVRFTDAKQGAKEIAEWVEAVGKTPDYWLQFNYLRVEAAQNGAEKVLALARDKKATAFTRAGAVQALATQGLIEGAALIPELIDFKTVKADKDDQRVLIAACASALVYLADEHLKEKRAEMIPAAESVINLLADKKLAPELRVLVARHLSAFLRTDRVWMTAEPWLMTLRGQMATEDEGNTSARPAFMGLEIRGKHPVFVIDFSDSMLIPLSEEEKKEMRRGPITPGPKEKMVGPGAPDELVKKDDKKNPLEDLPWDKIKTRFDAARECLKVCLRGLTKDMTFAVIKFGDRAEPLAATSKMVTPSAASIEAACKELDEIKPGKPMPDRDRGTLMGQTRLHTGVAWAFRINAKGVITTEDEHINKDCLETGADSIIVLSDGVPTWDDYAGYGPDFKYGPVPAHTERHVNPETGKEEIREIPAQPAGISKNYVRGPFEKLEYYQRDLIRMNLFRRVEISCIGVGEFDKNWLEGTAKMGCGTVRTITNKK